MACGILTISKRFDSEQAKERTKHESAVQTICYFLVFCKRDGKNRWFSIFFAQDIFA
jgi:hypothetical protein